MHENPEISMIPGFSLLLIQNSKNGVKIGYQNIDGYKWVTRGLQVGYTRFYSKTVGNLFTSATSSGMVFSV